MKTKLKHFKKYQISGSEYIGAGRRREAREAGLQCVNYHTMWQMSMVAPPYAGDHTLKAQADAWCGRFQELTS